MDCAIVVLMKEDNKNAIRIYEYSENEYQVFFHYPDKKKPDEHILPKDYVISIMKGLGINIWRLVIGEDIISAEWNVDNTKWIK